MYAAAPSFFRHAMRAFGQPPPEEALPLLTCANSPEAAAAGQAGLGGGLGVARRVLRLIVSKRWLDVDAIVGRDPHLLLALLVVLGTGIYLLQRLFIKSFLRVHHSRAGSRTGFGGGSGAGSTRFSSILPEAEEQRVGEKCVRVFLHRVCSIKRIDRDQQEGQSNKNPNPPTPQPNSASWSSASWRPTHTASPSSSTHAPTTPSSGSGSFISLLQLAVFFSGARCS